MPGLPPAITHHPPRWGPGTHPGAGARKLQVSVSIYPPPPRWDRLRQTPSCHSAAERVVRSKRSPLMDEPAQTRGDTAGCSGRSGRVTEDSVRSDRSGAAGRTGQAEPIVGRSLCPRSGTAERRPKNGTTMLRAAPAGRRITAAACHVRRVQKSASVAAAGGPSSAESRPARRAQIYEMASVRQTRRDRNGDLGDLGAVRSSFRQAPFWIGR